MQIPSAMDQAQMTLHIQMHGDHGRVNDCTQDSDVGSQGQHHYRATAPRSMTSPNWRGPQPSADLSTWLPANQGNYALAVNSLAGQTPANADMRSGGLAGYAYCLDRGNGHYTRLIPADMLPPLRDIPAHQPAPAGMVILPELQRAPPQGVPETNKPVSVKVRAAFSLGENDPRMLSAQAPTNMTGLTSDMLQKQIDHIVATTPGSPKKPKVYCDKWIHEGVCAFAQQGCKYKHEMPRDKELQTSLGLYHGFPLWWRRYQAEIQRQQEIQNILALSPSHQSFDTLEDRARLEKQGPATLYRQAWRKGRATSVHHPHPPSELDCGMDGQSDAFRLLSLSDGSPPQNVWGPIERPKYENCLEPVLVSPRRNAWAPRKEPSNEGSPAGEGF